MDIDQMTKEELWETIQTKVDENPEYIEGLNAVYAIQLTGETDTDYEVTLANGKAIIKETISEKADCSLKMSFKNFKKLLTGNLNATGAVMTGKIKVKGNIGLALKLEQTFKQFSM